MQTFILWFDRHLYTLALIGGFLYFISCILFQSDWPAPADYFVLALWVLAGFKSELPASVWRWFVKTLMR